VVESDQMTVDLLNADLYGEHDAILYYITHAWTVARQYGEQILEIANDEMRHFKWLGHTIAQLGGTPDLTTPPVSTITDLQAALHKDVEAEIQAINQYQEHADIIANTDVQLLLRRIMADERDHLRQFQELLQASHGEAHHPGPEDPAVASIADQLQRSIHGEYQRMITYLLQSFVDDHTRRLGLDMEERSIDEMRHMGWIGKRIGEMGVPPQWTSIDPQCQSIASREPDAQAMYQDIKSWAGVNMPALIPTIDRILAQESYHASTATFT